MAIKAGAAGQLNVLPAFLSPRTTVLFCDADRASLAVFSRNAGRLKCEHQATAKWPADSDAGGTVSKESVAALSSLCTEAAPGPVVLVLPAHLCLLKHLRLPRVDFRKRTKLVEFEAAQRLPCALSELSWDSVVAGEDGANQDVLLAAAKTVALAPLCAAAQAAGLGPQQIVPFPLVLLAGCRLARTFAAEPELVLHLGSRAATLLLLDRKRFAVRSWLIAGGEQVADRTGFTKQLAQETVRSVLHLRGQSSLATPGRLWLVGEKTLGACDESVLAPQLGIPVQAWDQSPGFDSASPARTESRPVSAELAGAAAAQLLKGQATLNLLPKELRTKHRRRGRRPWLVAAAVVLASAPIGPVVQYHRMAEAAERKAAEIETSLVPWRRHEGENRKNLEELATLRQQISALQSVQQRRTSWLRLFGDWQERFATLDGVWIDRLQLLPATPAGGARIGMWGRMLMADEPANPAGADRSARAKALLRALEASPFVEAVEAERFDARQPGMLGFELVLVSDKTVAL